MNNIPVNNGGYTDFSDLSAIRHQAVTDRNGPEALEQAAKQFEALFLQMMLKSMRDAGGGEGLFDNEHTRLYQDMFDKQLSLNLSQTDNGIGLAKVLVQQLKATIPALQQTSDDTSVGVLPVSLAMPVRGMQSFSLHDSISQQAEVADAANSGHTAEPVQFESPEHFVSTMWPHALEAGEALGVDPRAILAQAALETGWGRAVIRKPDGSSSHNLFNIKADQRWDGERVNKLTLEYKDGVAVKENAAFRSYGSYAESFRDYVNFLQNNGRYHLALESGPDIALFSQRLQQAGYATDPAYASKIQRIANGELISAALDGLKNTAGETLS